MFARYALANRVLRAIDEVIYEEAARRGIPEPDMKTAHPKDLSAEQKEALVVKIRRIFQDPEG